VRYLFCTRPFYGHFNVMAAVAWAAQDAGHDVAFATAASFGAVVEGSGFVFLASGLDPRDRAENALARPPDDPDWGEGATRAKVRDLLDVLATWCPDVLIREQTDFAGLLAAEATGLPVATYGPAMFIPGRSWRWLIGDKLDRIRRDLGVPPDPTWERTHPYLYLDPVPPWYQLPAADDLAVRHVIRPGLFDGAAGTNPPPWLKELPARPTVYVTLGTVFNHRADLFWTIFEALGPLPINALCTLGPDQTIDVIPGPPPDNIRVDPFVPQSQLLPYCDLVVSHGGFSTVMGALAHGLPVLILPLGSDNAVHARQCVSLGLGRTLVPESVTVEELRGCIWQLLTTQRWRREAQRRSAEIAALPGPSRGVDLISRLALRRAPIPSGD
jgi:UDP:flavonoid glycosyltransferase YjiC (YdhE family)